MKRNKAFDPHRTRVVALAGHRSSGKTSLGEVLLTRTGVTRVVGRVDDHSSLLDHEAEERRRSRTLRPAYAWLPVGDGMINLVDTPGWAALAHERQLVLQGSDAVLVVIDATAGVEVGTEQALQAAERLGLPVMAVLNKVDRPCDVNRVLQRLQAVTRRKLVPLQHLERSGTELRLSDVLLGRAWASTLEGEAVEVNPAGAGALAAQSEAIHEAVALSDDALLEQYLEYLTLEPEVLHRALHDGVSRGRLMPVVMTSAERQLGDEALLHWASTLLPSAAERPPPTLFESDGTPVSNPWDGTFAAQLLSCHIDMDGELYHVFRVWSGLPPRSGHWINGDTGDVSRIRKLYSVRGKRRAAAQTFGAGAIVATWEPVEGVPGDLFTASQRFTAAEPNLPPPMVAWQLRPQDRAAERGLLPALQVLRKVDPGIRIHTDKESGAFLIAGHSEPHLELALRVLRGPLGVAVRTDLPPVDYRETPLASVSSIEGLHVRADNDGLPVEYGRCEVSLVPVAVDAGNRFEDKFGDLDELPAKYRPAIDEGVQRGMRHGPTAGYPVLGAKVELVGGQYDMLQSEDEHFVEAGKLAVRAALQQTGTRLLEPWWRIDVYVRPEDVGAILADIQAHRGRVIGLEVIQEETKICALTPYRELRTFASRLLSLTHGRGRYFGEASHYESLPKQLEGEAIRSSPYLDQRPGRAAASPSK